MKKQSKSIIIPFMVPVFVLLAVYMVWGQYPFGENTLLIWDMEAQYAPFFSHLHEILHGNASALYTFSRALGGNMLNVASYYLISPFNLIFYFFSEENIYIGILLVTLLKTGACAASMHWFLNRRRQDGLIIVFSTAYALSAYMVGYSFNIFWIDALILLPFVCDGIERLADEGRYLLYTLSIALAVITNFYTGYMVCLFSVMYFFCYFFFISDKKYRLWTVITYILASAAGGMLSMFISLPTLDIMREGKSGLSLGILKNFKNMFKYGELFDAVFCANISDKQITSGKPLIYCGVFALIMALYWVVRGKDRLVKKLAYIMMLAALVISFHHYNLHCVWHAFNEPKGSPYRFAFIYIFIFLYMAYKGYCALADSDFLKREDIYKTDINGKTDKIGKTDINGKTDKIGKTDIIGKTDMIVIFGIGLALAVGLLLRMGVYAQKQRLGIMVLNIILAALYVYLICILKNKAVRNWLILFCTCAELFINAVCLYSVSTQYESADVAGYQAYVHEMRPLVDLVKEGQYVDGSNINESVKKGSSKAGIHRTAIDRSARRTSNDPFMFSLYGLDSYTSVEKQNVIQIAGRFGYSNNILWGMHYNNGSTAAGESFLGVKYLISAKEPEAGYALLMKNGNVSLYENENALPFAFLTDNSILEAESFDNTFQYMNELYRSLDTGSFKENIFSMPDKELVADVNCARTEYGGLYALDASKEAYIEYEVKLKADGVVYTRYDKAGASKAEMLIGGEMTDLSEQRGDVKCLGSLDKGSVFSIRFELPQDGVLSPDKIYLYSEDEAVLAEYAEAVFNQEVNIKMNSETAIDIACTNEDDAVKYLLCTIPYDKGWRVFIDGKRLKEVPDVQNFVAVPIAQGSHEIELRFVPVGLYAGLACTLLTAVLLAVLNNTKLILNIGINKMKNTII